MQQHNPNLSSESLNDSDNSIKLEGLDDVNFEDDNIDDIDQIIADVSKASQQQKKQNESKQEIVQQGETIDQFICNFFLKNQFEKSLEIFQEEWVIFQKNNQIKGNRIGLIPDIYIQFEKLNDEMQFLKGELERVSEVSEKMQVSLQKLIKQRDFHKLNFQKSQQEKKQLQIEIDKLKQFLQLGDTLLKQSQIEQQNQEELKSIKKKNLFKNSSILSQISKDEEQSQSKEMTKFANRLPSVQNKVPLQLITKPKK